MQHLKRSRGKSKYSGPGRPAFENLSIMRGDNEFQIASASLSEKYERG